MGETARAGEGLSAAAQWAWEGPAPEVLYVAGEHSGDQHAAELAQAYARLRPAAVQAAVGGPALAAAGVRVLHDLVAHSVVGLVEVLRHYGAFKALFEQLIAWIERIGPQVVVLVDYPGFNLRLAAELKRRGISRKGGGAIAVYQYVSPQIWAWKARRRFKMAEVLDELGVIFPFEVDCYADTALPVRYVGHPFLHKGRINPVRVQADGPVLLLPGSRRQAVGRIFPQMLAAYRRYRADGGRRDAVVLYPDAAIRSELEALLAGADAQGVRLQPVGEGIGAGVVLSSSGTMSFNCALAGLPGAIVYRAHPLTYAIGRMLVGVQWLGIASLILGETYYPEYVQGAARPQQLAAVLRQVDENGAVYEHFAALRQRLEAAMTAAAQDTAAERVRALALLEA